MRLSWTSDTIPHGYLCDTPIHLIYRVHGCGCVGELKRLVDDATQQYRLVKQLGVATPAELQQLIAEQMEAYDALLDAQDQSSFPLASSGYAQPVLDSWKTLRERQACRLYAVCVMGNHVHVLLAGISGAAEARIGPLVRRHKSYTDHVLREEAGMTGTFWDTSFYDRYVRPGRFYEVLRYILDNPVKAGLVGSWQDWRHTWVDERCVAALGEWEAQQARV